MLAHRVADELDDPLHPQTSPSPSHASDDAGIVGYAVRHERRISSRSRIIFITEGLLLRRMLARQPLGANGPVCALLANAQRLGHRLPGGFRAALLN
ncbi:MAG: hypothetical protein HC838_08785, partial [Spirulinaceae cyanobacterium RM2_2_10]|nr:hypothetical protein [Spirulinaceae cyanobacterium RM2_2_10]